MNNKKNNKQTYILCNVLIFACATILNSNSLTTYAEDTTSKSDFGSSSKKTDKVADKTDNKKTENPQNQENNNQSPPKVDQNAQKNPQDSPPTTPSQEPHPESQNTEPEPPKQEEKKPEPPKVQPDKKKESNSVAVVKNEETVKANTSPEQNRITLPDISDNPVPVNQPSTISSNQYSSEKIIKGILSWIMILSGVALIIWVILQNRKIAKNHKVILSHKQLKLNKNHKVYYKNLRRK